MRQYIAKRVLLMIPVLLGVSLMVFTLMRIIPGDVVTFILGGRSGEGASATANPEQVAALRSQLGLDKPLHEQYLTWVWGIVRLDAGNSLWTKKPVVEELKARFPVTLELALMSMFFAIAIGVPIGVISALRQDTWVDYLFRVIGIAGLAVPNFWLGTLIILFLLLQFHWIPPLRFTPFLEDPGKNLQMFVWPALALGYRLSAIGSRMTRSQMLEVLREDYIRTAWAKGLRERVVIYRHALKNALLPVITIWGIELGHLLGGTVVIEVVFGLPGMGRNLIDSIRFRDYTMVQGTVVFMATIFVMINLAVDLVYAWLDPRIRYS